MKVALTGATSGIGAGVAAKLHELGHQLVAFDIHEPKARVDHWIKVDMADPASIERAADEAGGGFDALINNAGLPPREGLEEAILRVNYCGLVQFLDLMIPKLTPGASIVNTASRAGAKWRESLDEIKALMALDPADLEEFIETRAISSTRAYVLSKEAVIVYTMAATQRMIAQNLRMNSVSPAAVSTGILDDFTAAFGDAVKVNLALVGRPGAVGEIADVIVFLASPASAWIKGQDIVIDGGMSALKLVEMLELDHC